MLLIFLPALVFGQAGKLRGIVTDTETDEPLIGANILVEGTELGAATDVNGVYVILAVPPGVYTIRATYIGYQTESTQNIRVFANQTTTQDYSLSTEAIRGEALVVVAEKPLIQRNTTNTVRMTTEEDIQNLPIRGFTNILALNAGTVRQDGTLHIRGGRSGEVAFYVDGATATNPMYQSQQVTVIQEAIEEIQMQAGGFTAEYGGANSGVVNTQVRTGGSQFRATLDYRTDDFVGPGEEFLGTTSQGYHNVVATIGGPLMDKIRFFVAGQYNYQANRTTMFIDPFKFDPTDDTLPEYTTAAWEAGERNFYAPWFVEDGLSGRTEFLEQPLTNTAGEVIPFEFMKNWLPNNEYKQLSLQATVVGNVSKAFKLRLTGSYSNTIYPNSGWSNFYSAVNNYYADYQSKSDYHNAMASLRATHILNPTTFYDITVSWSTRRYKNYDPRFGDEWWKYSDRMAWEESGVIDPNDPGYQLNQWQRRFEEPLAYSTILDFTFYETPYDPKNSYSFNNQDNLGGALDFTTQLNKNIEVKFGGRVDSWVMRTFSMGDINNYMVYRYGMNGESWPESGFDLYDGGRVFESDYIRQIELTRRGSIGHYGYDYDGETKIEDGAFGPRKPFFGSAYLQTKFEYRDLILNLGLRYERFDYNQPRPEIVEAPVYDATNEWIDVDALVETEPYDYILPRLNFAFPVTDNTVFYAQYGKYAQTVSLNSIFQTVTSLSNIIPERRSVYGSQVAFLAKPERTDQYELGIRQTITPEFAFTITAFYKDLLDQLRRDRIYSDGALPSEEGGLERGMRFIGGMVNNDIGTSKGLEFTLELRRTQRLAARLNYTLSDTRGTGSSRGSNNVVMSDVTVARYPSLIYPLDYNQTHRGSMMLDYRFAKGDGGKVLEGVGLNMLLQFNSGHAYTAVEEPYNLGQANPWNVGTRMTRDHRFRNPTEPLNSSTTPWNFTIDMTLEKMLYFGNFNVKVYTTVLNLLNTKNIINVYQTTGTDNDDGWLKSPLASQYVTIPGYEPMYRAINLANGWGWRYADGTNLWSAPRQIRFGLMFELH